MSPIILALAIAAQGAAAEPFYEGIARDSFAAWSYTSGQVAKSGDVLTTSVQTLYDTPTPFNGNPTPVAYSIHTVAFDCAAKTAAFINGANYSASGKVVSPGSPTPPLPWTDGTEGFQKLAAVVCAVGPVSE